MKKESDWQQVQMGFTESYITKIKTGISKQRLRSIDLASEGQKKLRDARMLRGYKLPNK